MVGAVGDVAQAPLLQDVADEQVEIVADDGQLDAFALQQIPQGGEARIEPDAVQVLREVRPAGTQDAQLPFEAGSRSNPTGRPVLLQCAPAIVDGEFFDDAVEHIAASDRVVEIDEHAISGGRAIAAGRRGFHITGRWRHGHGSG